MSAILFLKRSYNLYKTSAVLCNNKQISHLNTWKWNTATSAKIFNNNDNVNNFLQHHRYYNNATKPNELKKPIIDFKNNLDKLKSDVAKFKRVNYQFLESTIELAAKEPLLPADSVFLLECCSMMPDISSADKIDLLTNVWKIIVGKTDAPITKEQVQQLIKTYTLSGSLSTSPMSVLENFLKQYESFIDKDIKMYEDVLYFACEHATTDSFDGIVKILSDIKEKNLQVTENIFNALIRGHSQSRNIKNCEQLLDTMAEANLVPSTQTYTELIRAYIDNGYAEKAEQIIIEKGNELSAAQIYCILKSIAYAGYDELVRTAIQFLPPEETESNRIPPEIKNICIELIYLKQPKNGFLLLEHLPVPQFNTEQEDLDSYAVFFLYELIQSGGRREDVLEICDKLIKSNRNLRALHVVCEIALRNGAATDGLEYLKELAKIDTLRSHYFWPLFISFFKSGGENGVLSVLQEMTNLNVPLDFETMSSHVLPRLTITLADSKLGIQMLEDKGIRIGDIIAPYLAQLISQHNFDEATNVLQTHPMVKFDLAVLVSPLVYTVKNSKTMNSYKSLIKFVKMINSRNIRVSYDFVGKIVVELNSYHGKISHPNLAVLLEEIDSNGIRISKSSYDMLCHQVSSSNFKDNELKGTIVELLSRIFDRDISANSDAGNNSSDPLETHIVHPRDMTLDELECHLVQLQTKNLNVRGVLRKLLQMCVRAGKLERALTVRQMCIDHNVSLSPGMLASILELMIRTKNLNDAEESYNQLKHLYSTFILDEHKVIDFAALHVENNKGEDAKQLLKDRAGKKKVRGGPAIHKNLWHLLNNTAKNSSSNSLSTDNQTNEMLSLLVELGYCEFHHNVLLGPVLREHLLKGEIREACDQFLQLAKTYKRTPLQLELAAKLIEVSNGQCPPGETNVNADEAKKCLEEITEVNNMLHGQLNANVTLVMALAKSGTEKQLRKVLIDPKVQLNDELLHKQCEYLCSTGAIETLLKLAKCCQGLSGQKPALRQQVFYNLILKQLIRDNNFSLALGLYERIGENEEFKLSDEFKQNLVDLLERNKLEIPKNLRIQTRRRSE